MSPKPEIRTALRKIPNVNRAWNLIKVLLPDATRSRVREVLNEEEFARRRRGPGRKVTPRPSPPTTA